MMTNHVKLICFSLLLLVELTVIVFYITPVLAVTSAGFPLDDSWIYAVFARNFVASGEIAFNLGHSSLGFTSSLWFLLLSLGRLWKFSPIGWSIFMGCTAQVMLATISGLLVYRFPEPGGNGVYHRLSICRFGAQDTVHRFYPAGSFSQGVKRRIDSIGGVYGDVREYCKSEDGPSPIYE